MIALSGLHNLTLLDIRYNPLSDLTLPQEYQHILRAQGLESTVRFSSPPLRFLESTLTTPSELSLIVQGPKGFFAVEQSPDLRSWTEARHFVFERETATLEITVARTRFFRLRLIKHPWQGLKESLGGIDLSGANIEEVDLSDAVLSETSFKGANLRAARLNDADLRGAILRQADLTGADFTGAKLAHADLGGADLTNANLFRSLGFEQDQDDLVYATTVLPDGAVRTGSLTLKLLRVVPGGPKGFVELFISELPEAAPLRVETRLVTDIPYDQGSAIVDSPCVFVVTGLWTSDASSTLIVDVYDQNNNKILTLTKTSNANGSFEN